MRVRKLGENAKQKRNAADAAAFINQFSVATSA
jgi:hypothetical protein